MKRVNAARAMVAVALGLAAVSVTVAGSSSATAAGDNRRPICNSIGFNLPLTVGATVTIPVTDVAADPDLNPIALVGVFGGAPLGSAVISDNSTPDISHDDVLIFTRTSGGQGVAHLYWTVSDGSLNAQCVASGYYLPPGNG